jgi:hypothetical protein
MMVVLGASYLNPSSSSSLGLRRSRRNGVKRELREYSRS